MVRRIALCATMLAVLSFMGAKALVTQIQAQVSGDLESVLTLKAVPSNVVGGPTVYEITQKTIDGLIAVKKSGKKIVVDSEGRISLK